MRVAGRGQLLLCRRIRVWLRPRSQFEFVPRRPPTQLPDVPDTELAAAVEAASDGRVTRPGVFDVTELYRPVASASGGIWRLKGEGWSAVLKLVRHSDQGHPLWLSGEDVSHWYYWRRELLAYSSGLLAQLSGGLRAPRCYLSAEDESRQVRLWLENLDGQAAPQWPLDRYQLAARHLGRAQGVFVASGSVPAAPWLSRNWLRSYISRRHADKALLDGAEASYRHQLLAELGPLPAVRELRSLWENQPVFLATLDELPRTLCHLDLHPANMFDAGGETVLIDWSFVGTGAAGEDAGNLVPDSVLDFHVAPERIDHLWDLVVAGYLDGLADAGWIGDRGLVQRGMAASIAAKYAWIPGAMLHAVHEGRPLLNGRPVAEAVRWWAPVLGFLVRMGAEARS